MYMARYIIIVCNQKYLILLLLGPLIMVSVLIISYHGVYPKILNFLIKLPLLVSPKILLLWVEKLMKVLEGFYKID